VKLVCAALFTIVSVSCLGQGATTGRAETTGPCSPAVSGNRNTFDIRCSVNSEQGKQILEILNKILKNQMDLTQVNEKLDEILKNINPNLPVKTYFCNGQWRSAGPGPNAGMEIKMGGDPTAFMHEVSLFNAHQYQELLKDCQAQIDQTPEWLTPRLMCSLAYVELGDTNNAKRMLSEFESRKGPAYDVEPCTQIEDDLRQRLGSQ